MRSVSYVQLCKGLASYVMPKRAMSRNRDGAISGPYCYSVWLRHLVRAAECGMPTDPRVVAELGPGASLGVGITALLCGADEYHGLDIKTHFAPDDNLRALDEIVELLAARAPIPGPDAFPAMFPTLSDYAFPHTVLTDERLRTSLAPDRIAAVRNIVGRPGLGEERGVRLSYEAPWTRLDGSLSARVDMVVSQAVLEHVDDLPGTYEALSRVMAPGGVMSHQIDFRSHGMSKAWNGHLAYGPTAWRLARGRRPYLLNRQPCHEHLDLMTQHGFEVVNVAPVLAEPELPVERFAPELRDIWAPDSSTAGAHVLALRR